VVRRVAYLGYQVITGLAILVLVLALVVELGPAVVGDEGLIVFSGSMAPAIHVGDLVIIRPIDPDQLVAGDVVTYQLADQPNVLVTHRVAAIATDPAGHRVFTTRGDANDTPDPTPVAAAAIVGKVVANVPSAGYLEDFTQRPLGHMAVLGIPALLLYLDYVMSTRRAKAAVPRPLPNVAETLVVQGRAELEQGRPNAALVYLDQAIALNPRLDEAWVAKARCATTAVERLAILRSGLTINPGSSQLRQSIRDETQKDIISSGDSGATAG